LSSHNTISESKGTVDAILKERFHGASNIKGVRFQLLYSLLQAFRLFDADGPTTVRLEGIEDADLLGLRSGSEFIQAKSSNNPWTISRLIPPLLSFHKLLAVDPTVRFRLALEGRAGRDVEELIQRVGAHPSAIPRRARQLERRLVEVGLSLAEGHRLAEAVRIEIVSEEALITSLRSALTQKFELGTKAGVCVHLTALTARFLDWAKDRREVSRADFEDVRNSVGEALAVEGQFKAIGKGLLSRLEWREDYAVSDFFDGKRTRPGHILAGFDVRRNTWLDRIEQALGKSRVCVLRAPSGQGKSALLYRYAIENGAPRDTYCLRRAETLDEVNAILQFLRNRAELGAPLLLLIDNADWHVRLWPVIAESCVTLPLRILITTRTEDWSRFARVSGLTLEVLEPVLDSDEARRIFASFHGAKRVDSSVESADYALERIGEPPLLLEFVYFLTNGRMLEDRLREQIGDFSIMGEDPVKYQLLRMSSLAATLGAELQVENLIPLVPWRDDPQMVLATLAKEYIEVHDGVISGLHWVRTQHLSTILHEGFVEPAATALQCLPAIPQSALATFVANALCLPGLNRASFLSGLSNWIKGRGVRATLAALSGIFEAGERECLARNIALFDDWGRVGSEAVLLVAAQLMPVVKADIAGDLAKVFGDKEVPLKELKRQCELAITSPRGLDWCADFLREVVSNPTTSPEPIAIGDLGRLLDWCALCGVVLPDWPHRGQAAVADEAWSTAPLADLLAWAQGLFRYDRPTYDQWFVANNRELLAYLRYHTDTIRIQLDGYQVCVEYIAQHADERASEESMNRLNALRSALPFARSYRANAIWPVHDDLRPTYDESVKDIDAARLHFPSDIEKNVVWRILVESRYRPDSYYRFLEAWQRIRRDAIGFADALTKLLDQVLRGQRIRPQDLHRATIALDTSMRSCPSSPDRTPEPLASKINGATKSWAFSYRNFLHQSLDALLDRADASQRHLIVFNFEEALRELDRLRNAFTDLLKMVPDYFGASLLLTEEDRAYSALDLRLYAWITDPPSCVLTSVPEYAKGKRSADEQRRLARLRHRFAQHLAECDSGIVLPSALPKVAGQRYAPLMYDVPNATELEDATLPILSTIALAGDVADYYCLIPVRDGMRLFDGAIRLSSSSIAEMAAGGTPSWECWLPIPIPGGVMAALPTLPLDDRPSTQVLPSFLGLLHSRQYALRLEELIADLGSSPEPFDRRLHERQSRHVEDTYLEIRTLARAANLKLDQAFGGFRSAAEYRALARFGEAMGVARGQAGATVGAALSADQLVQLVGALSARSEHSN
jgi:hypothetical protein